MTTVSSIVIYGARGEILVYRAYKDDVSRSEASLFGNDFICTRKLGQSAPILTVRGCTYVFVPQGDVTVAAMTRSNANAMLIVVLLWKLVGLLKVYFGASGVSDMSVRKNFVLIYELLDEVLDYGVPQIFEFDVLKKYVTQGGAKLEDATQHEIRQLTAQATGAVIWRGEGIKYRKNEVYLDVIEKVNVQVSRNGQLLSADVVGRILVKSQLSGIPECRLGLNDKLALGRIEGTAAVRQSETKSQVALDNLRFHQCVRISRFENDRTITFTPPDGSFELMTYRVTESIRMPFHVLANALERSKHRLEISVRLKALFPRTIFASNIMLNIPCPKNAVKADVTTTHGLKGRFDSTSSTIVCRIRRTSGQCEYLLTADVELIHSVNEGTQASRLTSPITLEFQVPMFAASGLAVRFLRVFEKSNYKTIKWIRYMTQAGCVIHIEDFIVSSLRTSRPDSFLGFIQSAFIIGLSLSCPLVAFFSHRKAPSLIVASGVTLWSLGGLWASAAHHWNSYSYLFIGRILSGVGEAALVSLVPPLVLKHATRSSAVGLWLGAFSAMIPIGTAVGYCYGSFVARSDKGWGLAFLLESVLGLPFVIVFLVLSRDEQPIEDNSTHYISTPEQSGSLPCLSSFLSDFKAVTSSTIFIWIAVTYASYAGSVAVYSTFGSAFLLNLGLISNDASASLCMGVTVATAGVVGSLIGGALAGYKPVKQSAIEATQSQSFSHMSSCESQVVSLGTMSSPHEGVLQLSELVIQLSVIWPILVLSLPVLCLISVAPSLTTFNMGIALGLIGLFATQASLNIATMLSVPKTHKTCSIAFVTLLLHLLGDIPSPVITGYLKDILAPHCVAQHTSLLPSSPPPCERGGIRSILLLTGLWLCWMAVGVHKAKKTASRTLQYLKSIDT